MKKLSLMVPSETGTAVAYALLGGQTGYLPISSVVQCYKKKETNPSSQSCRYWKMNNSLHTASSTSSTRAHASSRRACLMNPRTMLSKGYPIKAIHRCTPWIAIWISQYSLVAQLFWLWVSALQIFLVCLFVCFNINAVPCLVWHWVISCFVPDVK